ncbi:UNVERIFIED_CONTAM: hypothetical protein PYX00_004625 [Menopon gallinae]|uniref:Uncharacterized protein n=1 Tax=Menopon gallinae TaxID=328185 RepID=A0AAW2I5V9_9NEOP
MSNEVVYENGTQINLNETSSNSSNYCNYSALAQKSEFQPENNEHGVTCYTCVNVSDNHVCNKYAIDRPCKFGNNFCHTLHIMDPKGRSVLVNKKCANETECTPRSIGCYYIDNQKICISCCDEDYCNKKVPTQPSNAIFKNTRTLRQKLLDSYKETLAKNRKYSKNNVQDHYRNNSVIVLVCYFIYFSATC